MKILIASATYWPDVNGASYFTQRLAHYLQKNGHKIMVVCPSRSIHSGHFNFNGMPVFGVRSFPILLYKDFRFSPPIMTKGLIRQAIKEFQPDVIHIQSHFMSSRQVAEIAQEMNIPVVGTNHFMPENLIHFFPVPQFIKKLIMRYAWKQFRKVFDKVNCITCPTQTAANLTKRSGIKMDIIPLSNGIDMERFNKHASTQHLRQKYHLPDKPFLITVGRLDKEKNIDLILRAVKLVPKEIDLHFVIAGKGAEKNNLEKLTKKLGLSHRVSFLGFVPDEELPGLYATSCCFINSCIAELQCIAAMEAMATGLPVIAANAVALPELVHHGENGYLFQVGDTKKMAEHISQIFSDGELQQKMSAHSLEIIKKHDIKNVIGKFEEIYQNLIKKYSNGNREQ